MWAPALVSSGSVHPIVKAPVCASVSMLDTGTPSTRRWTIATEGTPFTMRGKPRSSNSVPLTTKASPAVRVDGASAMVRFVWPRTTNCVVSFEPTNPVEPGVPANSTKRSAGPTLRFSGTAMLPAAVPFANVVKVESAKPGKPTKTC